MSRRKKKQQHRNNHEQESNYTTISSTFLSVLLRLFSFLELLLTQVVISPLDRVRAVLVIWLMSSSAPDDPGAAVSKKQKRLLNKQNKMMAEYRLVQGPQPKKIKLDNGGSGEGEEQGTAGVTRKLLDPEEFKRVKRELADRKKALTQLPRFTLTQVGTEASIHQTSYSSRCPLYLPDIQHLITYAYGGNVLIPPPSRWCTLQKPNRLLQLVVLVVDGVGLNEFVDNEHLFSRSMGVFGGETGYASNRGIVEVLDPQWYGASLQGEVKRWGLFEVEDADEQGSDKLNQLSSVFPIIKSQDDGGGGGSARACLDKFPRTSLVLTLPQLIQESYPLPIPSTPMTRASSVTFVQTAREYAPVHANSPMFAIDCEMVEAVGDPNALAKVAIVDEELKTVYETLVRPKTKIVDYRTRWSGITSEMLQGVEVRLKDVQDRIKQLVRQHPDCILVGQSLNCDLMSLRMIHPYVIDTSVCFNLTGIEGRKSKLKDLVLNLLDEVIQVERKTSDGTVGHCPVEDATAVMKLVKAKLANDVLFGNAASNTNSASNSGRVVQTLDQYFKEKRNTLDKDVFVIHHVTAASSSSTDSEEDTSSKKNQSKLTLPILYHKTNNKLPAQEKSKIKEFESSSNRATIKLAISRLFEQYMTVAHYRINLGKDLDKEIIKLDKRVHKLFNKMCDNSMIVVLCSNSSTAGSTGDHDRKNNGVALVRVKVANMKRRID